MLGAVLVISSDPLLVDVVRDSRVARNVHMADTAGLGYSMLHERPREAVVVDTRIDAPPEAPVLATVMSLAGRAPVVAVVEHQRDADAAVLESGADDALTIGVVNPASLGRAIRYSVHRRTSEWELAASEARNRRLAAIIEAADDLVVLVDAAERVFFTNPAAGRFFGDVVRNGPPVASLFHSDVDWWNDVLPELLLTGWWRGEMRLTDQTGARILHSVTVMHHERSDHHHEAYFSLVCHDLSALEAAAEKTHLERLARSKDQFVASVSHELRTPLTAVMGFAEMLASGALDGDESGVSEATKTIASQAREVADIIEDLIVGARADIGRVTIHPQKMNLGAEVRSVAETLRRQLASDPVIECGDVSAYADPLRVRQIIRNLITNVIRYGGDHIVVDAESSRRSITLVIRDDGAGVPVGRRESIFDAYESNGHEAQPGAVGLGLTVSRQLARLMGGDLTYDYVAGWSEFRLELPAEPVETSV